MSSSLLFLGIRKVSYAAFLGFVVKSLPGDFLLLLLQLDPYAWDYICTRIYSFTSAKDNLCIGGYHGEIFSCLDNRK